MALNTLLAASKITGVAPAVEDIRNNPGQFPGLARTRFVPAEDADIIARVSSRISAGGIYPDGAPAVVEPAPSLSLVAHEVANFKRAFEMKPSQISLLARVARAGSVDALGDDPGLASFGGFTRMACMQNRMGNMQRMENTVWGMFCDTYTYNRLGTSYTVTWGKPTNLKPVMTTPTTDAANSKPITAILDLKRIGLQQYGVRYDRLDISTADLDLIVGTAEYQAKSGVYLNAYLGQGNVGIPAASDSVHRQIVGKLLDLDVVINDESMPVTANGGGTSFVRHLPLGKGVLSRKADDNTGVSYDFGNATVLETAMMAIAQAVNGTSGASMVGGLDGVQERGPVSFAVLQPGYTGLEIHDVVRGWPRMLQETATAVITFR